MVFGKKKQHFYCLSAHSHLKYSLDLIKILNSLPSIVLVSPPDLFGLLFRDLLHMGVTLAGHQRKILSSIQTMPIRNKGATTVTF